MPEGIDHRAVGRVIPNVCGLIDLVTEYTQRSEMKRVHAMYSPMMSRVMSGNRRRGQTSKELKVFGSEVRALKKVVELSPFASTSGVYSMNFHLLDNFVEEIRRFGEISDLHLSASQHFKVRIKQACRGLSRMREPRMKKTVFLIERKQENERPRMSTESRNSSPSLTH